MRYLKKAKLLPALLFAMSLYALPVLAQQEANPELSSLYTQVEAQRDRVEELKFKLGSTLGSDIDIVEDQLLQARQKYQTSLWDLAERLSESPGEAPFMEEVITLLEKESSHLKKQILSTRDMISEEHIKLASYTDGAPPDKLISDAIRHFTQLISAYGAMLDNIDAKGAKHAGSGG